MNDLSKRAPDASRVGLLFGPLFLCFVGLVVFAFTEAGFLVVLAGGALFFLLLILCFAAPERMFLLLAASSILINLDVGVKLGDLPRIGPTRVFMAAFILALALRVFFYGRLAVGARFRLPLALPVGLYLLSGVISAATSVAPLVSAYAVFGREIIEQFLFFYLFIYFLGLPGFFGRLKSVIYAATILVCLYAAVEAIISYNPIMYFFPEEPIDFRAGILRCRATFFHPIALGCYLNLVAPFVLADLFTAKDLFNRLRLLCMLALICLASFLTVSRAPWICLAMEIGIFILFACRRNISRLFQLLILGAVAAAIFFLAYQSSQTVNKLFHPFFNPTSLTESSTPYYRWVVIKSVMDKMDLSRTPFGFGPNAFFLAGVKARYGDHVRTLTAPDMHYAKMGFEFGLVGLGLFLLILIMVMWRGLRAVKRAPPGQKYLALAGFAGVLGFIVVNFTVSMFQIYPLGMLFWLCAAISESIPLPEGIGEDAAEAGATMEGDVYAP